MKHFHPNGVPMKLRETDPLNNAESFFIGIFFVAENIERENSKLLTAVHGLLISCV